MKKYNLALPFLLVAVVLAGCSTDGSGSDPIAVSGVTMSAEALTIATGESVTLTATITPADASDPTMHWTTADQTVATVSDGVVEGVGAGTTTITVTTVDGGHSDTCDVTVVLGSYVEATAQGDVVRRNGVLTDPFDMVFANDKNGIVTWLSTEGSSQPVDSEFFIGRTEVTNGMMADVLQWAYDSDRFSTTFTDPNGISENAAKQGNQVLMDFSSQDSATRIAYSNGTFTVEPGYENHPVINVSWYGAIMFCNWLTEMENGNIDEVVYSWSDDNTDGTWQGTGVSAETSVDTTKKGYRLVGEYEWFFAARFFADANGDGDITDAGEYYPANHISGDSSAPYDTSSVYDDYGWFPLNSSDSEKAVGTRLPNTLGLFDMSGNVWELAAAESFGGVLAAIYGGSYQDPSEARTALFTSSSGLQPLGDTTLLSDDTVRFQDLGFRIARTR